jgi:membrane protease YdiL (CAAX protease family)
MAQENRSHVGRGVLQVWSRIPALIRGPVAGYAVGMVGISGSSAIMEANFAVSEPLPWSVPLILFFLSAYVIYFRGAGWPSVTSKARREAAGWEALSKQQWQWAGLGSIAIFVFVPASIALTFRFIELPPGLLDRSEEIAGMPLWVAIAYISIISLTAGIVEEIAFRGYMQRIIARRHGAWVGILVAALIFWFAHFNHESGPVRAFLLFGGGVLMGYLAWKATSIVPLVIAHTSSDIYTGLISRNVIDGSYIFADSLVLDTGLDTHFVFWSGLTILCIVLVIYAGQKLNLLSA